MKVHVIDNFFDDPMAERERALGASYERVEHNGLSYSGIAQVEDDATFEKIQKVLGVDPPKTKTCFYRNYLADANQETFIHNDSLIGTFSVIAFLTLPKNCHGGLAFWKHKLLGWDAQPTVDDCARFGLVDHDEWFQRVYKDGDRQELWEMTEYVPMIFNRAVFFYSPRFHSRYPKDHIGESIHDCRLIKTFFYQS